MCAVVAPPANMPLPCGCGTKGRGLWKVTSAQAAGLTQHVVHEIAGDVLKVCVQSKPMTSTLYPLVVIYCTCMCIRTYNVRLL